MATRRVKIGYYTYRRRIPHPRQDGELIVRGIARRNEEVEFDDVDVERGERLGVFYAEGEFEAQGKEAESSAFDIDTADDDALVEYLESENPNVDETVALAGDDAELADRLLVAEEAATDGEPRQGVIDGLTKIVDRED